MYWKLDKINALQIFFKQVSIVTAAVTPRNMFNNHFRVHLPIVVNQIVLECFNPNLALKRQIVRCQVTC